MFRLLVRAVGLMFLAGAFAAAVLDGARSLADQRLTLTPAGLALATAFPTKFVALENLVHAKAPPFLWDPVLVSLLYVPTFLFLAVLGLLMFLISRPRRPPAGFRS